MGEIEPQFPIKRNNIFTARGAHSGDQFESADENSF
jgi:hypothetical protein